MSMFEKYEDNSYTAYNLTPKSVVKSTQLKLTSPIVGYDTYRNPQQFIWDPEDSFTLKILYGKKIKVFDNDLILTQQGQKPSMSTAGVKGQKAYNIIDGISWLCRGIVEDTYNDGEWIPIELYRGDNPQWEQLSRTLSKLSKNILVEDEEKESLSSSYVWEEQNTFEFPTQGTKEILVNPYNENTTFSSTIMNFRHEVIYEYKFDSGVVEIEISRDKTPLLVEGQYFLNTYVKNNQNVQQQSQFNIMIKENPVKYIQSNTNTTYQFDYTIQVDSSSDFIWEPIGNGYSNDYIWIPIS